MNIEEKLKEQFDVLKIDSIDEPKGKHNLHADYVELVCVISKGHISANEIINRISDNGENESQEENLDGEIGSPHGEENDKEINWIVCIFDYLEERQKLFGNKYPFKVKNEEIKLKTKLNVQHQLYIYLLLSSSLKFFKVLTSELTSEFEIVSKEVLKNYLPRATVFGFGSQSDYQGNAKNKIEELAKKIGLDTDKRVINQINKHNSKEEGLDVGGWIPFEDNNPNTIIIFAQCACGKNWLNKQGAKRYNRFYHFYLLPFIHALLIPYDLEREGKKFKFDIDITNGVLLFERKRILELLNGFDFNNFESKKIVDAFLKHKEDIV